MRISWKRYLCSAAIGALTVAFSGASPARAQYPTTASTNVVQTPITSEHRLPPVQPVPGPALAGAPATPPAPAPLAGAEPHVAQRHGTTVTNPERTLTTSAQFLAALQDQSPDSLGSPVLDPNQPGNLGLRTTGPSFSSRGFGGPNSPILDPNQAGNLQLRLNAAEQRLEAAPDGTVKPVLPIIRLSGFMQLDEGLYDQTNASHARMGDMQNGVGFRRTRLQAIGKLTDFTGYTIEMDFATIGRPSFMDVWGEQSELPFFGTVRIGHFRQPGTMDSWTSIRHLEFLERSAPFQALDPFRRVGVMAYAMSEDELTMWAYSVYGTGLTFWNGTGTTYSTLGDTRAGAEIGDSGGVSVTGRMTHLLYYDEMADGRYLLHVGGGYNYSQIGGSGYTGNNAKTYRAAPFPEFFVGDPAAGGVTAGGTPFVLDTGRVAANSFNFYHTELAGNYGPAHFQQEFMLTTLNQRGGPPVYLPGTYFQCGYFLTGESCLYLKQAGVLDYNVVPYSDFFGTGRRRGFAGFGAWEVAFRYSYVDLTGASVNPGNQLSNSPGPPPSPNNGVLNETTVALNWWWNKFTRLQFNWIHSMPNYANYGLAPFDIYGARFQIEF